MQLICRRWMACARNKLWWMTPEWGKMGDAIPTETQFLLLENGKAGPYTVLLPLLDGKFRATLKADRDRCELAGCALYGSCRATAMCAATLRQRLFQSAPTTLHNTTNGSLLPHSASVVSSAGLGIVCGCKRSCQHERRANATSLVLRHSLWAACLQPFNPCV